MSMQTVQVGMTYAGIMVGHTQEERMREFLNKYSLPGDYQYELMQETLNPYTKRWYMEVRCIGMKTIEVL